MILAITREFVVANYIECGLWLTISLGFAIRWIRVRQADTAVAAIAFGLFGLSDYLEAATGAWWRPWWLLLLKGACLVVFLVLLVRYWRARRRNR